MHTASKQISQTDQKQLCSLSKLSESLESYKDDMVNFLIDLVSISSESCNEEKVTQRTKEEMEKVGFDSVKIDDMGNVIGKMGNGKRIIAMDAHLDTVGTGKIEDWETNPLQGIVKDEKVYGLGAVDQKAGMASMVYGAKLIKEHNLLSDYTLYVVGSIQEEDCDGLCWRYIIDSKEIEPECVVITEPTNLNIYIGQRGRMEIDITTKGKSAHGSMPELGDNAVYSMSKIVREIELLNEKLKRDPFLGKGTVVVSDIKSKAPSMCSVPYECTIHLDRRLTFGENKESALAELREAVKNAGVEAEINVPQYSKPSYKNLTYPAESYFPTWKLPEDHKLLSAAVNAYEAAFSKKPFIDKWTFSTNGIATMGVYGIPTIGFGPGDEKYAHSANEFVPVSHLVEAAKWYALFPLTYAEIMEEKENE